MLTLLVYWLTCGLLTFFLVFGDPVGSTEIKDFDKDKNVYVLACLVVGGFAIPYMAISYLLEGQK